MNTLNRTEKTVESTDQRKIIPNVEKLEFGPPSDVFSQALKIAAIIREAGQLDRAAVAHLESALASWDKTHAFYMKS